MSEPVVETVETPSPDAPEQPATDFAAEATEYKNRFAGSQRKLTETLNANRDLEAELESIRRWKAEKEQADMTELERWQAKAAEAERVAQAARAEAQRERLARKFPHAADVLGDNLPSDEDVLAALEERLSTPAVPAEPEPRIDPNNPRRVANPPDVDPMEAADAYLKGLFDQG